MYYLLTIHRICQFRMIPGIDVTDRVVRDYVAFKLCTKYEWIISFAWTSDWKF